MLKLVILLIDLFIYSFIERKSPYLAQVKLELAYQAASKS